MKEIVTHINEIPIKKNFVKNLPYNSKLKDRARALRKAGNYAEVAFWLQVHKGKFHTIDFDRQRVIGNFIVDFYVKSLGLVIEIDGEYHTNKDDYDSMRSEILKSYGLNIFITNDYNVLYDMENVLKKLEGFIIEHYS